MFIVLSLYNFVYRFIYNNSIFIFQKSKSTILNITIYKKINEYFISTIKEKNNLKKDGTEKFI